MTWGYSRRGRRPRNSWGFALAWLQLDVVLREPQSGSDYHVQDLTAFQRRCKAVAPRWGVGFFYCAHVTLIPEQLFLSRERGWVHIWWVWTLALPSISSAQGSSCEILTPFQLQSCCSVAEPDFWPPCGTGENCPSSNKYSLKQSEDYLPSRPVWLNQNNHKCTGFYRLVMKVHILWYIIICINVLVILII